ncbi:hypothetical protein [Desulfocurvus sp.]|jgi:hypothetical protein|uniref:hypothetical protein n=1 Tax=Desulfocurvus sp. TaxID=2871698 RepID=UPI0025BDE1A1|nr:hypothetical protein [Desulfocurvus sp.]MCK9240795.1 hypothetical protein [Desulfocurvus sp.]
MVDGIGAQLAAGGDLQSVLEKLRKGEGVLPEDAVASAAAGVPPGASREAAPANMLAGNFVSERSEPSEYVSALQLSTSLERQMTITRVKEVIANAMPETVKITAQAHSSQAMRQATKLRESLEANEENLDRARESIEEKAEQAVSESGAAAGEAVAAPAAPVAPAAAAAAAEGADAAPAPEPGARTRGGAAAVPVDIVV